MNKHIKSLIYIFFAALLILFSEHLTGSLLPSLYALALSLFLYTYNTISAADTIPDTDYLVSGEGPVAAAALCLSLYFGASLPLLAAAVFLSSGVYLIFFKNIIAPGKKETALSGLLLSASVWLPLIAYTSGSDTTLLSITGGWNPDNKSVQQLTFLIITSVIILIIIYIFKHEFKIISHGNGKLLFSQKKLFMLNAASWFVRSTSVSAITLLGGLAVSYGYFLKKLNLVDKGPLMVIPFFCIAQLFFIASSAGIIRIETAVPMLALPVILYFSADFLKQDKNHDYDQ